METMKAKISVTVEKKFVDWVDEQVETMRFRNRSHAVEYALAKFIEREQEKE
jgi:Arc/MetJ-type ribon-helix-helix transcriptional regulator